MEKKILFFIPSIEEGGVEKNLYLISDYFIKKKLSVEVITCNFDKKRFFNKKIKIIGSKSNFLVNKSRLIKNIICIFYLFVNLLKNNKNTLVFSFQANSAAALISKLTFTRIISRSNSSPSGWTGGFLKRLIYRLSLTLSNNIIVNSKEFQKEFYRNFKTKVKCIYNPFNKSQIINKLNKTIKPPFKKKYSLKIISVGRLTDQKDQITLLKAAKLINKKISPEIIIIGKGKNYFQLRNYINKNNLNNIVKLLGYQPNPYSFIKKSDIVVLTSKYEGLPNILLEAQFLNKYIISTNCPTGPNEILLNGKAGDLIKIGDFKNLAKLINNFYKNKSKINKKILIGKRNFYRFDYKINCEKYYKLIYTSF